MYKNRVRRVMIWIPGLLMVTGASRDEEPIRLVLMVELVLKAERVEL